MSGTNLYQRNRSYEYFQKGTANIKRRVRKDNLFHQFNNRSNNYGNNSAWSRIPHWHEFHGAWTRHPRVQDTRSSYAAANQRQTFSPKFPLNLSITIPNFSGVHPPDLFLFRKSSAKSVKFATAPGGLPRSSPCFPANKDVRASHLKSNATEMNGDVEYLYTVSTRDELVEVVDLSEDSEVPKCADKLVASDRLVSNTITSFECGNDWISKMHDKETVPGSDAAHRKGRKRKISAEDLHCHICESDYEFVKSKGGEIFKSRCGHMFCQQCLKDLDPYKCPECKLYIQKLFKVFL